MSNIRDAIIAVVKSDKQFPVDFDELWYWCGYSRKDNARTVLTANFERDLDFSAEFRKTPSGGRPSEIINLTVDAAKQFALLAQTSKGKEIRKYFIYAEQQWREQLSKPTLTHTYAKRLWSLKDDLKCPRGYWVVLEHCTQIMLNIEYWKYPVGRYDLIDGAVGTHWRKYREGKEWTEESTKAKLWMPERKINVYPHAYKFSELEYFQEWRDNIYSKKSLPIYLAEKYGSLSVLGFNR